MKRIVLKSRGGSDGTLQLAVPVGQAEAGREVQVTVEPVGPPALSPDEWRRREFGLATWDGEIPVFVGFYGSFLDTLQGM